MPTSSVETPDGPVEVTVDGPQSPHLVVIVPDIGEHPDDYAQLCARLHQSDLRTAIVATSSTPTPEQVAAVLGALGGGWANLVGHGAGADAAWWVAATTFGRVRSLIAIDRGHPGPDSGCPPVEVQTTVIAVGGTHLPAARASGPRVYAEFRVVELADADKPIGRYCAELASEISLRSSTW